MPPVQQNSDAGPVPGAHQQRNAPEARALRRGRDLAAVEAFGRDDYDHRLGQLVLDT